MSDARDDLPVTPSGISFEEWAALLTGGTSAGSSGLSAPKPAAVAPPAAEPEPVAPTYPPVAPEPQSWSLSASDPEPVAPVDEMSPDAMTEALEASWRAILNSGASDETTSFSTAPEEAAPAPAAAPVASAASVDDTSSFRSEFDAILTQPAGLQEATMNSPQHPSSDTPLGSPAPLPPEWTEQPAASLPATMPLPAAAPTEPLTSFAPVPVPVPVNLESFLPPQVLPTPVPAPAAPAAVAAAPVAPASPRAATASSSRRAQAAPVDDADDAPALSVRSSGADPELVAALTEVVLQGASDLHVTSNAAPNLRVHGSLKALPGGEWSSAKVRSALYTLLSDQQKAKFERELELDFAYSISANARFRVNFYQQRANIGAAFRLIPTEIKQLGELGVPESVSRFATLPRGLVLVTGPTGSGKSTTLAALIDLVNQTRADHIVTVEDPIEFMHNHKKSLVNQREVGHDTHSFASALKHVLRQDPDVILVGELRDLETISVALTAAETGHLVFATLHTQSASQTIDRIIDVYPPHQQNQVRAQLAATLQGVVCQTLIKKASGQGRVVATEVLITTPAVSNLIREGQTHQVPTAMQAGASYGMHTLDQHLAELVNRGIITQQAALDKAHDPEGMLSLVHRVETRSSSMSQSGVDFGDAYSARGRH